MLVRSFFRIVLFLLGCFGLICYPGEAAQAVRDGLVICGTSVIPALFPFFVLTKSFLSGKRRQKAHKSAENIMRRCFGLGGECLSPLLLSFVGGYPVGAASVAELYQNGAISNEEAERLLLFCNNSGPAFFLGVIGTVVLSNVKAGLLLYIAHVVAALCCGALLRDNVPRTAVLRRIKPADTENGSFLQAVSSSCSALLQISGLILFFSVVLAPLEASGIFRLLCRLMPGIPAQTLRAMLCGIFELSGGIIRLQDCNGAALLCAFLMGWGGFCVHLQAMSFWKPLKLRPKGYYFAKLLHGALSALFSALLLVPDTQLLLSAAGVLLLCVFFPEIRQKMGRNPRRNTV